MYGTRYVHLKWKHPLAILLYTDRFSDQKIIATQL